MPGADRNLLRIAVYEMRFLTDEEVSDAIVINEAVELCQGLWHRPVRVVRQRRAGQDRS